MRIQALILLFLLGSSTLAIARGPAVEDFAGIEMEGPDSPPQGTEGLFNFEKEMKDFSKNQQQTNSASVSAQTSGPTDFTAYAGYSIILLLPLISWMLVWNHLKTQARAQNASNLQVLENYRKEKEKKQEEIKKAS